MGATLADARYCYLHDLQFSFDGNASALHVRAKVEIGTLAAVQARRPSSPPAVAVAATSTTATTRVVVGHPREYVPRPRQSLQELTDYTDCVRMTQL